MPKILRDPTSFAVYDLRVGGVRREIIIIGEVHDIVDCHRTDGGVSLADFIKDYHESIGRRRVLDIYSESFYVGDRKLGWLPTLYYLFYRAATMDDARALSYIRKRLDACSPKFNFSFYKCPENVRVHLCDVRFTKEMGYSALVHTREECAVAKLFRVGLSYIHQDKIPRAASALRRLIAFVQEFLFDQDSPAYHDRLTKHILLRTKVLKQIRGIRSPGVRDKLTEWSHKNYEESILFARKEWRRFQKHHGKVLDAQPALAVISDSCLAAFVESVSLPILYVISVFMDMYLTARLLRRFADGTHATNAVVYVGEYHAKQYRQLMRTLGAKRVYYKTSMRADGGYTSCVDITGFYEKFISLKKKQ